MNLRAFAPICLVFAFASCTSLHERADKVRKESLARKECALHKKPMITTTGYDPQDEMCVLYVDYVYRALDRYPNAVPLGTSLKKIGFYTKPVSISYCAECERKFSEECARHNKD